jgi:oligoendopeptidase F
MRLRRYDVYAPIAKSDKRYDFDSAAETVLDSFRHFNPQLSDLAGFSTSGIWTARCARASAAGLSVPR